MSTVNEKEDRLVKCCDCNDIHKKSDRPHIENKDEPAFSEEVCPECESVDYYEL